jgi:hypothetical protein
VIGTAHHAEAAPTCFSAKIGDTLVKKPGDAVRIAFAAWRAANPRFRSEDEAAWAKGFTATLRGCVWEISENPIPPRNYGTFVLRIGASDGRFLGATISG